MKNNIRLSILLAAIAVLVSVAGIASREPNEPVATDVGMSWAAAFPVAQAGVVRHAAPHD